MQPSPLALRQVDAFLTQLSQSPGLEVLKMAVKLLWKSTHSLGNKADTIIRLTALLFKKSFKPMVSSGLLKTLWIGSPVCQLTGLFLSLPTLIRAIAIMGITYSKMGVLSTGFSHSDMTPKF
jgi:hypothetical protein